MGTHRETRTVSGGFPDPPREHTGYPCKGPGAAFWGPRREHRTCWREQTAFCCPRHEGQGLGVGVCRAQGPSKAREGLSQLQ